MGDLTAAGQVQLQPLREGTQLLHRLVFVDLLVAARSRECHLACSCVELHRGMEAGVLTGLQAEEHLIGFPLVFEVRRLVGLKEVEVEVPWRLCGGALIRRTKEQVATSASPVLTPLKFMLPDAIAAHIGRCIGLFENHPP